MLENIISIKNLIILLLLVFALFMLTCVLKSKKSIENYSNGTLENVKNISIDEKLKILYKTQSILQTHPQNIFENIFNDGLLKIYQSACYLRDIDNNYYNVNCADPKSFLSQSSGGSSVLYSIYTQITEVSDICKYKNNNSMRICSDFILHLNDLLVKCINFIEMNDKICPCDYSGNTYTVNKYLGCFKDSGDRDLPIHVGNFSLQDCSNAAKESKKQYFGLQNQSGVSGSDGNNIIGECWLGNSYGKHGATDSCKEIDNNNWGQAWSNSIYNTETKNDSTPKMCNPC